MLTPYAKAHTTLTKIHRRHQALGKFSMYNRETIVGLDALMKIEADQELFDKLVHDTPPNPKT